MRMHGHAAHDDMKYVPAALVEEWRARDPIDRQEARLGSLGRGRGGGPRVGRGRDRRRERGGAGRSDARSGDGLLDGVFCEGEAEALGDGLAPWSGFASGPGSGDER